MLKKHIYITIIASILVSGSMYAQQNRQTGPLAKNRKPWNYPKAKAPIMVKEHKNHDKLTGPLAKNRKPWNDKCEMYPVTIIKRERLTGPMAKNKRPERRHMFTGKSN